VNAYYDANFNVTGIQNYGSVQERFVYSAYGTRSVFTPTWGATSDTKNVVVSFQGLRWDPLTGQYVDRARDVSPALMRAVEGEPGGGMYVDGMNLYPMYGGNPVNHVDPGGLETISAPSGYFVVKGNVPLGRFPDAAQEAARKPGKDEGYQVEYIATKASHCTKGEVVLVQAIDSSRAPGGSTAHFDVHDNDLDPIHYPLNSYANLYKRKGTFPDRPSYIEGGGWAIPGSPNGFQDLPGSDQWLAYDFKIEVVAYRVEANGSKYGRRTPLLDAQFTFNSGTGAVTIPTQPAQVVRPFPGGGSQVFGGNISDLFKNASQKWESDAGSKYTPPKP
jgi:RHS repeat-associated protein